MADGFQVGLGALVQATDGVNGAITDLRDNKVSDIGGWAADYGAPWPPFWPANAAALPTILDALDAEAGAAARG